MIILHDIPLSSDCILWANDTDWAAKEPLNDDGHRAHYSWPMSEKRWVPRTASDQGDQAPLNMSGSHACLQGASSDRGGDQLTSRAWAKTPRFCYLQTGRISLFFGFCFGDLYCSTEPLSSRSLVLSGSYCWLQAPASVIKRTLSTEIQCYSTKALFNLLFKTIGIIIK